MFNLAFVLRLNAATCLCFGIMFMSFPSGVSLLLGNAPPELIVGLGMVLIVNGVHLIVASIRKHPLSIEILWFSMGDIAWWLATLTLIATGVWITTKAGITLALVVALCVATLGLYQLFHLGLDRTCLSASAHWKRIGHSWMSLPLWVKIWLFALNAAFLFSPVFLPWEAARIVLIAYVASGPLLFAFALFEGGLTRAMGLSHLLPWVPMLVWMTIWIDRSEAPSLALGYATFLSVMTTTCLILDTYDLIKWIRGERGILST